MKHCVTTKILMRRQDGSEVPFEETLLFLKAAGFEEIDMGLEPPLLLASDWEEQLEDRLRLCEREQIHIRYAHMPYHYPKMGDAEGWAAFELATRRAMDYVVRAGVDCAAIHPRSFMTRDYDPEKEYREAKAFLEPYQDYAVQKGLVLALENMRGPGQSADPAIRRFGMAMEETISLADELGMGICWDTGHGNISGHEQYAAITQIGKRLRMVHLNDNFAEDDVHLALFLGNIDWKQVAKGLVAVGYKGSLNTEVQCNKRPDALRPLYARYMAEAVQELDEMIQTEQAAALQAE